MCIRDRGKAKQWDWKTTCNMFYFIFYGHINVCNFTKEMCIRDSYCIYTKVINKFCFRFPFVGFVALFPKYDTQKALKFE